MGYSKLTYDAYISNHDYWAGQKGVELPKWASELSERGCVSVSAIDFYDDIFGEDLEEARMPEDYVTGEYGAIAIERVKKLNPDGSVVLNDKGEEVYIGNRYTITKGQMELYDLIDSSENFCMMSPISYAGRRRTNENARYLYALAIEVDHIEPKNGITELFHTWKRDIFTLPKPTYIVCSGNGLHLYYVFEKPIPLWKSIFENITEVKKYFTPLFWNRYVTTAHEEIEWESLNQPFRLVGTKGKRNCYAMAFRVGDKINLEYLNGFLPEHLHLSATYKSKLSLEKARELYPKWYKRRIEEGKGRGHWTRHEPIYYNWIEKIKAGAVVGKRYNCLENLCSLAVQCNISPEQVEKDCREVAEVFERMTDSEDNHFTEHDVLCALKTYYTASEKAYRRKTEFISKKTGIPLIPNDRNYRKAQEHLHADYFKNEKGRPEVNTCKQNRELALKFMRENGEITGRPVGSGTKEQLIKEYAAEHPEASVTEIARALNISRPTVYKWLK